MTSRHFKDDDEGHILHSPPPASSLHFPPFRQACWLQPPAALQHPYTPNTRLLPDPAHSCASPAGIGSPLNCRSSRQPMKSRRCCEGVSVEPKSKAPWERSILHGSVRGTEVGRCWSRVSLRKVELTSSRTLCQRPSATGGDWSRSVPEEPFPHSYLSCSSPSVTWKGWQGAAAQIRLQWTQLEKGSCSFWGLNVMFGSWVFLGNRLSSFIFSIFKCCLLCLHTLNVCLQKAAVFMLGFDPHYSLGFSVFNLGCSSIKCCSSQMFLLFQLKDRTKEQISEIFPVDHWSSAQITADVMGSISRDVSSWDCRWILQSLQQRPLQRVQPNSSGTKISSSALLHDSVNQSRSAAAAASFKAVGWSPASHLLSGF